MVELLAGAVAACLLENLSRSRALLGFECDAAEVDVVVEREEQPPQASRPVSGPPG